MLTNFLHHEKILSSLLVLCYIILEIGKQIFNYSINYYNGGSYPLPQTSLVSHSLIYAAMSQRK